MTLTGLNGSKSLLPGQSTADDRAFLLSLPLALAGKAKHHPSSREDAFLSQLSLDKEKAAKQSPNPARFFLPTTRRAKRRWRFRPYTAKEMLASKAATEPRRWIVDTLIPENSLAQLTAFMKVGKSTFIYQLALAIARGIPFLDYPTQRGRVLILCVE